ncbi:hypothetical protein K491DRAFT_701740 [Lophiostoma macrostomum CBS 122681]|uniref:Uncharacterized protein n=1 Tax=Lophiostoma macrostomum CBS 122681 TaxID=1314788 RepID=A0A6A6TK64_9PLEO|nr:hypothetical protein K491DRAFT_701740 [Lophiostoma macrostomum CBS 122681]
MSRPEAPLKPAAGPSTPSSRVHYSNEDQKELASLDKTMERMKKAVPPTPYILSVPTVPEAEYKHRSQQEMRAWMIGHLFRPEESSIQYRSFLYREPYQNTFSLSREEDFLPEDEKPKPPATTTPRQLPKKVISLSDYKSKQANGVITPGSKKVSPNLAPSRPLAAPTNGVKDPAKQELPEAKINVDKSAPSNATPHGLPPLLSPVAQTLNNPYGLPAILSPTLPSKVQAELDKLETQRKRGDSNASTSSSDRKSQLLPVPESRTQKHEEDSKSNSRNRSASVNGKSPTPAPSVRATITEPRLIVKLKYGKKQAATVTQLLRLPPTRKNHTASEKKDRQDHTVKETAKVPMKAAEPVPAKNKDTPKINARRTDSSTASAKTNGVTLKAAEKRPRNDDDASLTVPSKRPKPLQVGPSTPSQQAITSPAMSNKSSTQKSQAPYVTPRKDIKAISMLRSNSMESYDSTPGRSGHTPAASKLLDPKALPSSTPSSNRKQNEISALFQRSQKLNQLGRTLKHDAQKIVQEKGDKLTSGDQQRVAMLGLECITSYMAAYHAQDQAYSLRGRLGDWEGTWKTLMPLCASYAQRTKDFPHLDGLRLCLSAVISATICNHIAQRAQRSKAHDSPQGQPQPEPSKTTGQTSDNFALLADQYMQLVRFTQETRAVLPLDNIRKFFPETYAGRELDSGMAKGAEKFVGGNLSGPYFLPVQSDTTPLQAVRFGLKFLGEYSDKEELNHDLRVNLGRPE